MDLWRSLMCLLFRRVYVKTTFGGCDAIRPVRWHDGRLWFRLYGQEYRMEEDGAAVALDGDRTPWLRYTPPLVSAKPLHFDIQQIGDK